MVIKVDKDKDEIWPVKVSKLSMTPLDDRKVNLRMRIQFRPEETDYPLLHRSLIRDAWIQIKRPKQMSLDQAKEDDSDAEVE